MKLTLEVNDCRDCPKLNKSEYIYGCSHEDRNVTFEDTIIYAQGEEFPGIPEWCPIKKQENKS